VSILSGEAQTVILENGFWAKAERDKFRSEGKALGARVELYALDVSIDELWRRVEARNHSPTNDSFVITRADLESWSKYFEFPTSTELSGYDSHVCSDL
jgi:hypothetical protein